MDSLIPLVHQTGQIALSADHAANLGVHDAIGLDRLFDAHEPTVNSSSV
jgi:hypothetical protein